MQGPKRITSKKQGCERDGAGGRAADNYAEWDKLAGWGAIVMADGVFTWVEGKIPADEPAPPGPKKPPDVSTREGVIRLLDEQIAETTALLDVKRAQAKRGDTATEIAALTRTLTDLCSKRLELLAAGRDETRLTDDELLRDCLEAGVMTAAEELGVPPESVSYAVVDPEGGFRLVPVSKLLRKVA